jgi:hypothetical protein
MIYKHLLTNCIQNGVYIDEVGYDTGKIDTFVNQIHVNRKAAVVKKLKGK